jgi:hypothetical protein
MDFKRYLCGAVVDLEIGQRAGVRYPEKERCCEQGE